MIEPSDNAENDMGHLRLWTLACPVGVLLSMLFASQSNAEEPPVFSAMTIDEAVAASAEKSGVVVIKFTAEWCAPCKKMDQTTWRDDAVVAWIDDNGIAISVDVDREKEVAEPFAVGAMPTMVALKDGEEFDRTVGYKDADELLLWLIGVKKCEREIERIEREVHGQADDGGHVDVHARLDFARTLLQRGEHERATSEYVWLWENMLDHESSFYGVRLSFMAGNIKELMVAHEPAREAFAGIRDREEEVIRNSAKAIDSLVDWVCLNAALGDEQRTLDWYLEHKDNLKRADQISRIGSDVREVLADRDMWREYGHTLEKPRWAFASTFSMRRHTQEMHEERFGEAEWRMMEAHMDKSLREELSEGYIGYLAAGRADEALETAGMLLAELDDAESRLSLVRWAVHAGQVTTHCVELLDEAEALGERSRVLRRKVDAALAERGDDERFDE